MNRRGPRPGGHPRATGRGNHYSEVHYRESLRTLGLFAPVELEQIQQAYRKRAKRFHPDRFAANGNSGETMKLAISEATDRIQKLNAAHEYAIHHHRTFQRGLEGWSLGAMWRRLAQFARS